MTSCEQHVALALELSQRLLDLSDRERDLCEHDDCLVLDGIVRDCAHSVRKAALERKQTLIRQLVKDHS